MNDKRGFMLCRYIYNYFLSKTELFSLHSVDGDMLQSDDDEDDDESSLCFFAFEILSFFKEMLDLSSGVT